MKFIKSENRTILIKKHNRSQKFDENWRVKYKFDNIIQQITLDYVVLCKAFETIRKMSDDKRKIWAVETLMGMSAKTGLLLNAK
jgi:hypothetical protein